MKKQIVAFAAALFVLAACHNEGSSTVGEKDQEYPNSFHKDSSHNTGGHTAPATHTAPADHTNTEMKPDTTHTTDSTSH